MCMYLESYFYDRLSFGVFFFFLHMKYHIEDQ